MALRKQKHVSCAQRGFTLIELLVVVAIIALLISILLPSLAKAREQAKKVKCMSNLKQVGTAMLQYFTDNGEWFPFEKRACPHPNVPWMHGFYYGGHPGRHVAQPGDPTYWWGYTDTFYRDTPRGRAFNRYMYVDLPDYDVPPSSPLYDGVRNLPLFRCPSDTGGFWNNETDLSHSNGRELYYEVGSSYDLNYHFAMNWAIGGRPPVDAKKWMHRSNAFLRQQMLNDSSRQIILYEDPFDVAVWMSVPIRGWHKEWMRHSLLFIDGHSNNILTDTTNNKTRGTGWKSCGSRPDNPLAWWNTNDPNSNDYDPDNQYKDISPLPGDYQ